MDTLNKVMVLIAQVLLVLPVLLSIGCGRDRVSDLPENVIVCEDSVTLINVQFADDRVLERRDNGYQIFILYITHNNELIAPIYRTHMPKVGGGTRLKYIDVVRSVGQGQQHIFFEHRPSTKCVMLLLRGINAPNGSWKFHEIPAESIHDSVLIPSLDSLPELITDKRYDVVMNLVESAKATRYQLENKH